MAPWAVALGGAADSEGEAGLLQDPGGSVYEGALGFRGASPLLLSVWEGPERPVRAAPSQRFSHWLPRGPAPEPVDRYPVASSMCTWCPTGPGMRPHVGPCHTCCPSPLGLCPGGRLRETPDLGPREAVFQALRHLIVNLILPQFGFEVSSDPGISGRRVVDGPGGGPGFSQAPPAHRQSRTVKQTGMLG